MTMAAERRSSPLIVGGGAAVVALLVLVLFTSGGTDESPPVGQPPQPPPPVASPPSSAPPPAAAAPASPQGLRLYGVAGAGAIIGMPDGRQRLIPVGRDVLPGLTLASVGIDHALLRSPAATYRLGFDGIAAGGDAAAAGPAALARDVAALREETLRYRLGLAPITEDGRIIGHEVRARAEMPALVRAGLRPGDVIRRINGSEFTGEQLEELAWTMANSSEVTFEIIRDSRPTRLALAR